MKMLIVDDEAHIRQMMRLTLEASRYEIDEAASGEEGLERVGDGPCVRRRRARSEDARHRRPRDAAADQGARARAEHRFLVKHFPGDVDVAVTVSIDPEVIARVERLSRRTLRPGGAFWRGRAERLLSGFLWSEGRPPAEGSLRLRDVSREDLDIAAAWESD
jgi:CheY-like chemotaxis protein